MYYSDNPIIDTKGDLLDRSFFAERLAEYLERIPRRESRVIGVCGAWGCGKTSLLNMTLQNISQDSHLAITRFDPWNVIDGESLVRALFGELKTGLSVRYKGEGIDALGYALEQYSEAIGAGVSAGMLALSGIPLPQAFSSSAIKHAAKRIRDRASRNLDSVNDLKRAVSNRLYDLDKSILVVIDNIDRLPSDLIALVFQLVASIADFPGVSYLLLYDEIIVEEAIHSVYGCDGEGYLEKIVQVPLEVPVIGLARLSHLVEKMIMSLHKEAVNVNAVLDQQRLPDVLDCCVMPFVGNLRDAKRFMGVLDFELSFIGEKIAFEDVVGITAIRVFCSRGFKWAMLHQNDLISSEHDGAVTYSVSARNSWASEISKEMDIDDSVAGKIVDALGVLFPKFEATWRADTRRFDLPALRSAQRIAHPDLFALYCEGRVFTDTFPASLAKTIVQEYSQEQMKPLLVKEMEHWEQSDLLYGILGEARSLEAARATVVAEALLGAIGLYEGDPKLALTSSPMRLLSTLLNQMEIHSVFGLLEEKLSQMALGGLLAVGHLLYSIEKRHGLASNGNGARPRMSVDGAVSISVGARIADPGFPIDAFKQLEAVFSDTMAEKTLGQNVFSYAYPRAPMCLWCELDGEASGEYLDKLFEDSKAVIDCVLKFVLKMQNKTDDARWSYDWNTRAFAEPKVIIEAIERVSSGDLWASYSEDDRERIAAAYLLMKTHMKIGSTEHVESSASVMRQIAEWEYEREHG